MGHCWDTVGCMILKVFAIVGFCEMLRDAIGCGMPLAVGCCEALLSVGHLELRHIEKGLVKQELA